MKKVNRVGSEMSDEELDKVMLKVEPDKVAPAKRGSSDLFPRMVKRFVARGDEMAEIDFKTMDRKWSAVAQSLRVALKDTPGPNGEPLSTVAYVSVSKADQKIYLRTKDSSGPTRPGRPSKKLK